MSRARICEERAESRKQSAGNRFVSKGKNYAIVEDLSGLIEDADAIFSKWVRLSAADDLGYVQCYTSGIIAPWQEMTCGHYVSRKCMYLRFDPRNCKPQHGIDNMGKDGNLAVFARKLNEENPGIVDILEEESHITFHVDREFLRNIISEYTQKLEKIKKLIP